jgi:ribonuclease P/MRP protein subunit RPP40
LGPLLFLVFINDIGDKLTVPFFLFADDAKLLKQISEWSDCVTLQTNLDEIMNWCTRNKLSLNINKCQVMFFSLKKENIRFDYTLSLNLLNRPETVKDLGVIFDRKLSFTSHIDHVVSDSMKQLGFLIRNSRDFQSSRTLTMLFNAFVRSKLHYACIIWQPHHNIQAAKLEQIIRKFLKYLYLRDVGEYPPIGISQTYLLNRFDCVSFATSCKKALAIFAFKLLHNILDCSEILSQLAFKNSFRSTIKRR